MYSTWIIYICLSTFLLMLCLVKSKLKVFHVPRTNWRSQRMRVISDSAPIGAIKQMHFVIAVMYVCIRVNIPSIYIVGALFFNSSFMHFTLVFCFFFFAVLVLFRHSPFDKSAQGHPKSSGLQRCSIKIAIYLMKMRRCCWRCCCRLLCVPGRVFTVVAMCRCWWTH